ncbi:FtsB family cell division protein [Pajaroellobacter abortibovis]|uniref:FtsB family cell division protein n=1 Tax=Pajaroellobacter abortibovis TaxID=1882918 RepID=UPI001561A668|nr:septum formation initiator family protein [Pajaroellobacter abortibovis]
MFSFHSFLSRVLPITMLIVTFVSVLLFVFAPSGLPRLHALQHELAHVKAQNDVLRRDIQRLQDEVNSLNHDPITIERVAREQLGLIRQDEVIFQLLESP